MKTTRKTLIGALTLGIAAHALADARRIPAEAKRVEVGPYTSRSLIVNGKEMRLVPGARIHSDANRTIVPGRVPAGAAARVLMERDGDLSEVWILTPTETAQSASGASR